MNPPQVSILLPVRNAADTLPQALDSLRRQTLTQFEILLVNDGSTDATPEIVETYARQDNRIRPFHLPPVGLVSALNHACHHARAPFLARMDADDHCHPERLARQCQLLADHPETDVAACRVTYGGDRTQTPGYAAHVDWLNQVITPKDHSLNRFVESPLAHPSVLWRREVMEAHGSYRDGDFPEDYELWLRWMQAGVRFRKTPETLFTWNDPPQRLSRTHPQYRTEAFYQIKCHYLARVLPRDRPIWLWGAGRQTRRRFATLDTAPHPFAGYIDIDPRKIGRSLRQKPVISPDNIPADAFLLVGVGTRGARTCIEHHLLTTGRQPARDYFLCA